MRTAARVLVAVLMTSWWSVVPAVGAAAAGTTVDLSRQGRITGRADALHDRAADASRALDRLYDEQRLVVGGTGSSGRWAQEWAAGTATRNGLGTNDVPLTVAAGDRRYASGVGAASRPTDARLAAVARTAVEPALRKNDRAGATMGADGYGAVMTDAPVPTVNTTPGEADPGGGGGAGTGAGDLVLPIAIVGGAAVLAAYTYTRRRRRTATRTTPRGGQEGWGAPEQPPLPELDARARTALVATDDAVRTSEEELGFATAQFGAEAARPFHEAVAHATKELTAAFGLRQQLDDAHPEDDAARRGMLDEILARCSEADRRLDAEAEDFDRLRALERNAPQALDTAEAAFQDVDGRVVSAEAALRVMRERYATSAAAPVANDVEQAKDRLRFAAAALDGARQAVEAGDNGPAAVRVRAAEAAVAQAARLIEAVDRRARELAEATGKLPSALTETETDVAEARGLSKGMEEGTPAAGLQGRIARAEAVAAEVRTAAESGRYDPIDALRRVEEADAALDEALARFREQEQGSRRAVVLLERALLGARSGIGAATDYITTHRGAVGSEARTRLAEARRRLERAEAQAGPRGTGGNVTGGAARTALAEAQRADWLAQQAQSLAENDVRAFRDPFGPGGTPGAGGPGSGLGGAVLGGILLGGMLGGGGRGGGPWGGFGGGPASFGGGGTRGRMGGGRF